MSDWAAPFSPVRSGTVIMSHAAGRDVWRTATLMSLAMLGGPRTAQSLEDRRCPGTHTLDGSPPSGGEEVEEGTGLDKADALRDVVICTSDSMAALISQVQKGLGGKDRGRLAGILTCHRGGCCTCSE